jgi:hypothetical protein
MDYIHTPSLIRKLATKQINKHKGADEIRSFKQLKT